MSDTPTNETTPEKEPGDNGLSRFFQGPDGASRHQAAGWNATLNGIRFDETQDTPTYNQLQLFLMLNIVNYLVPMYNYYCCS